MQTERDLRRPEKDAVNDKGQARIPKGYAVLIGIGRYKNIGAKGDLRFAETDARSLYQVLISSEAGAFPSENVHMLIGEEATLRNIRHELEDWLPEVAQPEDRVVVYFAGHGFVNRQKGYLAASDLDLHDIDNTAYPMETIGRVLSVRVRAHWKVLFTDACHSAKVNAETTDEGVSSLIGSQEFASQFLSFTAASGNESSYEDPNLATGFGVFSYFLVQGLKGNADTDPCDGWVRAGELVDYVRTQVRLYAGARGVNQTPSARSDYDPSMVLARAGSCDGVGFKPSMTGAVVIEVNEDEVDIWIDEDLVGKASREKPLSLPGLANGPHTVRAAKPGYASALKRVLVAPGLTTGVHIQLRYPQPIKPKALVLGERGRKLLYTSRSPINPVNIVPIPRSQSESDVKRARDLFARALKEDAYYSQAAYELGIADQLLSDEDGSMTAFERAIEVDPAHVGARLQYAGVLVESGDPDEAVRQLTEALRLDRSNDEAHSLLARAYLDKGIWDRCVQSAETALRLNAGNAMAHLWLADCRRQQAVAGKSSIEFAAARDSYREFVDLTNYTTPIHQWFAYHFIGFHIGGRAHPDREASFDSLRMSGFLGLCICERNLGNPLLAREHCRRAIHYEPNNATAYFVLGLAELGVFEKTAACEDIASARASFEKMLRIDGETDEARHARAYIEEIDSRMAVLRRRGCGGKAA
jgi:tetratricopeptide (TPR) repeat protein